MKVTKWRNYQPCLFKKPFIGLPIKDPCGWIFAYHESIFNEGLWARMTLAVTKWLIVSIPLLLCSCCDGHTLYVTQNKFKDNTWSRQATCTFDFTIQDATQAYDIYLLLQYTPDYPYQNLHITHYLKNNQDETIHTALINHLLFDPKTGKPLGKGWGKKKCLKLPFITNYRFEKPGDYSLALVQFMRTEQLSGVCSIGIQICQVQSATH